MSKDKTVRVLFDAAPLANPHKSGVGYYTAGLITALAAQNPDVRFVGHYFDFMGGDKPADLPQAPNISYRVSRFVPRQIVYELRRRGLPVWFELLVKGRGDFIIYPAFIGFPSLFKTPYLTAIHDLTYLRFPEYVAEKNRRDLNKLVPKQLAGAAFGLTISNATKADIQAAYPHIKTPILVQHIPLVAPKPDGKPQALPAKPYILFVSTLEPRKNFMQLVEAYVSMHFVLNKQYSLVLAGGPGWSSDAALQHVKKLQDEGYDIILAGYTSEATKANLYQNASAFVMPSLYEGFGMPLLEAMHYGVPIIASDIPVFHEVAGDAALYVDPHNVQALAKTMDELLRSSAAQQELIQKGKQRLTGFSWHDVARNVSSEMFLHIKK